MDRIANPAVKQAMMRGFFGIGVENLSKPHNAGSLYRTAHAFNASFVFAIAPELQIRKILQVDTSHTARHVPFYAVETLNELPMPHNAQLVGIELIETAEELPQFIHPERAVYILGPEKGSLNEATIAKCQHIIKIPTKFCVNVGIAGAIVLYDRYQKKTRT